MKFIRLASTLLLSSVLLLSCNKTNNNTVLPRIEFDIDYFSAYIGKPLTTFINENSTYLVGTSASGRVFMASGTYEMDGENINVNIFVNADFGGNVNRVLAQPVNQAGYGKAFWEHFTSDEMMPTLGTFEKAKYRANSGVVGECATLEEVEQKYEELSGSEPLMCAVCAPSATSGMVIVPILQNSLGGLLITSTQTTVYYLDLYNYFNSTYNDARNEFFIIGDVVETSEAKTTTLEDATDELKNNVTLVFNGSTSSAAISNVVVTPKGDAAACETFWREFLDKTDKIGMETFVEAALVGTDGKAEQTFSTKSAALTYLNQSGIPSDGRHVYVRYLVAPIVYDLYISTGDTHLEVSRYTTGS